MVTIRKFFWRKLNKFSVVTRRLINLVNSILSFISHLIDFTSFSRLEGRKKCGKHEMQWNYFNHAKIAVGIKY